MIDSDATVVFTMGPATDGSLRTIEFARGLGKPHLAIDLAITGRSQAVVDIVTWLQGCGNYDPDKYVAQPPTKCILNVAGNRESEADGVQHFVTTIMVNVLRAVNP